METQAVKIEIILWLNFMPRWRWLVAFSETQFEPSIVVAWLKQATETCLPGAEVDVEIISKSFIVKLESLTK